MNERRTIDKCKKILTMFEELKPRKQPQPVNRRKSLKSFNSKIHNRSCSLSETKSKDKYKYVLNTSCLSKKSLK